MRIFHELAFDGYLAGTQAAYTDAAASATFGRAYQLSISGYTVGVTGTSPTLTVQVEQSFDQRHWVSRGSAAEVSAVALSTSGETIFSGHDGNIVARPRMPFVRLRLALGGTSPGARARVWVTGRTATRRTGIVPRDVPGLSQWLRSDLGIVLGTGVSSWLDQSGNGNDVSQGSASAQPAYVSSDSTLSGLPSLLFDGTNDYLISTAAFSALLTASAGTIFCVARMTTAGGGAGMVSENTATDVRLEFATTPESRSINNDGSVDITSIGYTLGQWKVFQWRHGGGTLYHRQTLGTESSVASGSTASLANAQRIGVRSTFLNGGIAEVVIFDRALTSTEIADLLNHYFLPRYVVV